MFVVDLLLPVIELFPFAKVCIFNENANKVLIILIKKYAFCLFVYNFSGSM